MKLRDPRGTMKTYSHLAGQRRMPSEYEVATSKLAYHAERGFEVAVPLAAWYEKYQRQSAFRCTVEDWDAFADPRQTTYTKYTALQAQRESYLDSLMERIEATGYDAQLSADAIDFFEARVAPLRYPMHGLQMAAAYLGQIAPAGRITITCALQAADEVRRIQRIAMRMGQLRQVRPTLGDGARQAWEKDAAWQPLRETIERLLVAWDWGEAFAALQLCVKPAFDDLVHGASVAGARQRGDHLLGEIFASLEEDARWHREWTAALVDLAVTRRAENDDVLRGFVERWSAPATRAMRALT